MTHNVQDVIEIAYIKLLTYNHLHNMRSQYLSLTFLLSNNLNLLRNSVNYKINNVN